MDTLTKDAIDKAFVESLSRLLVVHNTSALTLRPDSLVALRQSYDALVAERNKMIATLV